VRPERYLAPSPVRIWDVVDPSAGAAQSNLQVVYAIVQRSLAPAFAATLVSTRKKISILESLLRQFAAARFCCGIVRLKLSQNNRCDHPSVARYEPLSQPWYVHQAAILDLQRRLFNLIYWRENFFACRLIATNLLFSNARSEV